MTVEDQSLAVIVRFHNAQRLDELDRALFSLCCQHHRPVTVYLMVQRFSGSDLAKLHARIGPLFSQTDAPKLIVTNFAEEGPADARAALLNLGMRAAEERFLAFLDYDDVIYPEAYDLLIKRLLTTGASIAFAGIACKYVQVSPYTGYVYAKTTPFLGRTLVDLFRANFCPIHSFLIDRMQISESELLAREQLSCLEDYEMLLRICAKHGSDFGCIDTLIGDYYMKDDGSNTVLIDGKGPEQSELRWRYSRAFVDIQKRRISLSSEVARELPELSFANLPTIADVVDWYDGQSLVGARENSVAEFVTPGHFYSPIVDPRSLPRNICSTLPEQIEGISLDIEDMESLWLNMLPHMATLPFPRAKSAAFRYFIDNGMYEYGDAAVYYAILRETTPSRIVEIGSGFSSALLLDTLELDQRHDVDVTFIEPYPDTLNSLLRHEDRERVRILSMPVQDVPLWEFERLRAGDILFIDSSHVLKTGSDVAFEIFDILPSVNAGVRVHFHDIFYPFEYVKKWVFTDNRSWNEIYALRAFLMYNTRYRVEFFSTYFVHMLPELVLKTLPGMLEAPGGNIWLVSQ
jgi:hypothetical protein